MARLTGTGGDVYITSQLVEDCEDAWTSGTNGTASLETTLVKVGSGSAKCVMSSVINGNYVMHEAISSMDLSTYNMILCWARCDGSPAAADLVLVLDSNSGLPSSPESELEFPALSAGVWKYCRLVEVSGKELSNSSAAVVVGLEMNANASDYTIYLDDIMAAKTIAGVKSWTMDQVVDTIDTTGFDSSGARSFTTGLTGWTGSFEGFKDGVPLTIGTLVGLELRESSTATQQFRGNVFITGLHVNTSVDGVVTYNYDFQGNDAVVIPTA